MSLTTKRRALAVLAALGAGAVAVPAAGSATAPERAKGPTVKVADDFYSPTSLSVKPGTKVKFKWDSANTNSHNVILKKGPKGISKKDFKSATGSIGIKFSPTFEKKGTYDLLCTIHPDVMKLKVNVKK